MSDMDALLEQGRALAALLVARKHTVAVAESASGGLISAALLAVPGASAFYLGGSVVYTPRARHRLLGLRREDVRGLKSATEPYVLLGAETVRHQFSATWGIAESGAAGPTGNPYGDAAGHSVCAIAGPATAARTLETGRSDRFENMIAFAAAALALLSEAVAAR